MSDKEWYEGLTASELEGKHVLVTYDEGCVVSGRMVECNGDAVIADGSCDGVGVLFRDGDGLKLDKAVRDFRLVWDERDWEQIPLDKAEEGDCLVVGTSLQEIHCSYVRKPSSGYWDIDDEPMSHIYFDMASSALRKRSKLPTEPGFYRDGDGTLYYLSTLAEFWVMKTMDKWECMRGLPDRHLPLTPVHFVDGRAE